MACRSGALLVTVSATPAEAQTHGAPVRVAEGKVCGFPSRLSQDADLGVGLA